MHFHRELYVSAKLKLFHFCQLVRRCAAVVAATRQVDISLFYKSSQNRDSISATRSGCVLMTTGDDGMTQWLSWTQNCHRYAVRFCLQFCNTNKARRQRTATVSSIVTRTCFHLRHYSMNEITVWMALQYEWHYSMNDTTVSMTLQYEWHYSINGTTVWMTLQW